MHENLVEERREHFEYTFFSHCPDCERTLRDFRFAYFCVMALIIGD